MIDAAARDRWSTLRADLTPFVARRVSPSDVDDVLQDVFVRVQRGLGALHDDERFGPWVYQVARSAVADHARKRARSPLATGDAPELAAGDTDGDGALTETEARLATLVEPFVAALPSPYREALTLTELEGLSQREAAARMGVSVTAMKSRVQRGRAQLREIFEMCCSFERDARGRVIACTPREGGRLPDDCCAPGTSAPTPGPAPTRGGREVGA
jgi:RNA polymerase sigma-70 factor (ECF subfamily)